MNVHFIFFVLIMILVFSQNISKYNFKLIHTLSHSNSTLTLGTAVDIYQNYIYVGTQFGTIKKYDYTLNLLIYQYGSNNSSAIDVIKISSNGSLMWSYSFNDNLFKLWETNTGNSKLQINSQYPLSNVNFNQKLGLVIGSYIYGLEIFVIYDLQTFMENTQILQDMTTLASQECWNVVNSIGNYIFEYCNHSNVNIYNLTNSIDYPINLLTQDIYGDSNSNQIKDAILTKDDSNFYIMDVNGTIRVYQYLINYTLNNSRSIHLNATVDKFLLINEPNKIFIAVSNNLTLIYDQINDELTTSTNFNITPLSKLRVTKDHKYLIITHYQTLVYSIQGFNHTYYDSNQSLIRPCDPTCISCNNLNGLCNVCSPLSYASNMKCLKCTANCLQCDNNTGLCNACQNGYILDSSKCVSKCKNLQYLSFNKNKCLKCSKLCDSCDVQTGKSTTCLKGYFLENNECKSCSRNCKQCFGFEQNCTFCNSLYELNSNNNCVLISNATLINTISNINSIPGINKLFGIKSLIALLDQLWLYNYDKRSYNGMINDVFQIISDVDRERWSIITLNNWIEVTYQIFNFSDYSSYSTTKHLQIERTDDFFIKNLFSMFVFFPIALLIVYFFFRKLFFLLSNYKISKQIRKFSFFGFLILLYFEGNIEISSYLAINNFKIMFSFKGVDKMGHIFTTIFFFMVTIYVFAAYFLFKYQYQKLSKYFVQNLTIQLKSLVIMSLVLCVRGFIVGCIHSCLFQYYVTMMILLSMFEIFLVFYLTATKIVYSLFQQSLPFYGLLFHHLLMGLLNCILLLDYLFSPINQDIANLFINLNNTIIILLLFNAILRIIIAFIPSCNCENDEDQNQDNIQNIQKQQFNFEEVIKQISTNSQNNKQPTNKIEIITQQIRQKSRKKQSKKCIKSHLLIITQKQIVCKTQNRIPIGDDLIIQDFS